jgi:hypothetical protein
VLLSEVWALKGLAVDWSPPLVVLGLREGLLEVRPARSWQRLPPYSDLSSTETLQQQKYQLQQFALSNNEPTGFGSANYSVFTRINYPAEH